jgi:hypothetical protein
VTVVRILVWNLADSKTTLDEVQAQLPALPDGDLWIANEPQERFGLVSTSGTVPDIEQVRDLIGKDPELVDEFDALE